MQKDYTLRLMLEAPLGEKSYSVVMLIDAFEARERYVGMKPPSELDYGTLTLDDAVKRMRIREYRKDDFQRAAVQLATKLGERMEDEEGWHGVERQATYERQRDEGKW